MSVIVVVEPDGLRLASQIILGLSRDEQPGEVAFRQDLDNCRARNPAPPVIRIEWSFFNKPVVIRCHASSIGAMTIAGNNSRVANG